MALQSCLRCRVPVVINGASVGPDGGDRILNVCGSPAILAKNRYGLTGELPLAWEPLYQAFSQRFSV
jgi:hypothetical protein